ncbi:hypothetical protein B0H15DRAFT_284972 [Mycena belliarum]|uniref:Uncharacterized protein n=1 Tax=Mycena belliarum TaxID=1033014 RepID=A0AAD6U2X0_9AGAR|nr:hypothetical protein B0H15DRAFT_284972 [Mycena belliae]
MARHCACVQHTHPRPRDDIVRAGTTYARRPPFKHPSSRRPRLRSLSSLGPRWPPYSLANAPQVACIMRVSGTRPQHARISTARLVNAVTICACHGSVPVCCNTTVCARPESRALSCCRRAARRTGGEGATALPQLRRVRVGHGASLCGAQGRYAPGSSIIVFRVPRPSEHRPRTQRAWPSAATAPRPISSADDPSTRLPPPALRRVQSPHVAQHRCRIPPPPSRPVNERPP